MKDIYEKSHTDDEFHVLAISEPTRIILSKAVDGFIIRTDGDLLFGWDYATPEEFTRDNAMFLSLMDNIKDFKKVTFTHLYLMPKEEGKTLNVYVCIQK